MQLTPRINDTPRRKNLPPSMQAFPCLPRRMTIGLPSRLQSPVTLEYFAEACRKLYIQDIDRRDLLKFAVFLRDEKQQSPRSCYNKFENLMTFLKAQGVRGLVGKNDWPRFVEEDPEIYETDDLEKLFAACDDQEQLWFQFFLMTGMREQEVQHTYWSDVDLNHSTVKVSYKPDRNWTPKAYKEREIPI